MPRVGEMVEDHPADVVARVFVFAPRVAEAKDDLHGGLLDVRFGRGEGGSVRRSGARAGRRWKQPPERAAQ
jgi:hypothetical protein